MYSPVKSGDVLMIEGRFLINVGQGDTSRSFNIIPDMKDKRYDRYVELLLAGRLLT